jgi:hypothetical protein
MRNLNYFDILSEIIIQERSMLIRTSIRPYEEITILSLDNLTSERKFQLFCKIKEKEDAYITISDEKAEYKFTSEGVDLEDINIGDIALIFGRKEDTSIKLEKLIKLNLDWFLLMKAKTIEQL